MPSSYRWPHTEVNIIDNSAIVRSTTAISNGTRMLFVIESPRGRDGVLTRVTSGTDEFRRKFGMGDMKTYGQPILNAYKAISSGLVTAEVLRIAAQDAKRANLYVYAAYKVEEDETGLDLGDETKSKKMTIRFCTAYDNDMITEKSLGSKATQLTPGGSLGGWHWVFLFAVCSRGRGAYSNTLGVRLINNSRKDRENQYHNYYFQVYEGRDLLEENTICFYDNALTDSDTLYVETVLNDPETGSDNIRIVTNPDGFTEIVDAYNKEILAPVLAKDSAVEEYARKIGLTNLKDTSLGATDVWAPLKACMTLSDKDFDYFSGINKNLITKVTTSGTAAGTGAAIFGYNIETVVSEEDAESWTNITVSNLSELTGTTLQGGSDGNFVPQKGAGPDEWKVTEAQAIKNKNEAYMYAFDPNQIPTDIQEKAAQGTIELAVDWSIYSKTQHPLDCIFDANYYAGDGDGNINVKAAIANLAAVRGDCMAFLDLGTGFTSKEEIFQRQAAYNIDRVAVDRLQSVDAYQFDIRDPDSRKIVTVTPTYWLAWAYAQSFDTNGGKHVPVAGGAYGPIQLPEMIKNSIYPVFDEAMDQSTMEQLCNYRINYAQINPKGEVIRATQSTRQESETALSEINNMFIVLDIKRDCERLCAQYSYNFLEASDLARFNRDAEQLLTKYAEAQVRSITATFSSTEEEQNQGILHLEVELQHKRLVKTAIVDIHVNA